MAIAEILNDKALKAIERREGIIKAIRENHVAGKELESLCSSLPDKQTAIVLEAIEAITRETPDYADIGCLLLAKKYILFDANNLNGNRRGLSGTLLINSPAILTTSSEIYLKI